MSNKPSTSQTVQHWLDTVPASFDPTQSVTPNGKRSAQEQPVMPANDPRVELQEAIGEGGMATVHRGQQLSLAREVAVKIKRVDLPGSTLDMLHEAWLTSALEHPNIVPIYDLTLDSAGDPMVLMRRIEGTEWGSLFDKPDVIRSDYGASDAMDWHLRVFLQVCSAVNYAHSMGIIHRDIKPANVMVGEHGQVYLLDWGIAIGKQGPLAEKLKTLRSSEEPTGTPCYMAPEMLGGNTDVVDERTDVFLLGATLYELVTGKPPHSGKTLVEVLDSIENKEVSVPDDLPSELQSLLRTALATDPKQRFTDVEGLRRAVANYLGHRSSYQLEQHAHLQLKTLEAALVSLPLDSPENRTELYKLYGNCRSAYRAALQLWDENPKAMDGLLKATTSMIDAEIDSGTPRAANALLYEIENPPDSLLCRVSDAQHSEEAVFDGMAHLASLAQNWNRRTGARVRVALVIVVGFCFGAFTAFPRNYDYLSFIISDAIAIVGLVTYGYVMRRRSMLNTFDFRAVVIIVLVFAIQLLRRVLAIATDMPPDIVLTHDGLVFVCIMIAAATVLEPRMWPSCFVYGGAHALGLIDIDYASISLGFGHAFMGLNTAWIWWPRNKKSEVTSVEQAAKPSP